VRAGEGLEKSGETYQVELSGGETRDADTGRGDGGDGVESSYFNRRDRHFRARASSSRLATDGESKV